MSRILYYSLPPVGHLFPVIPVLLELQGRGHEVLVATDARAHGLGAMIGLPMRAADARAMAGVSRAEAQRIESLAQPVPPSRGLFEPAAADLERIAAEEQPDFVLVDSQICGALIAAEAGSLPWGAVAHSCELLPTLHSAGAFRGAPPRPALIARLRRWAARVGHDAELDARLLPLLNPVRIARELPPLVHARELRSSAPLTLAFTAPPFGPDPSNYEASVHFLGPTLWEAPISAPTWLDEPDARPLIVISTSTAGQFDDRVLDVALEVFRAAPYGVVAIHPTGRIPESVPENVRVCRYVPHTPLLQRAACVLCHGGLGTTQKALAAGVPVVAVPHPGTDQVGNALRLEALAAGVHVPRQQLGPVRLRSAVELALERKSGAERVAREFRAAGGPVVAADVIEAHLSDRAGQTRGHAARTSATALPC